MLKKAKQVCYVKPLDSSVVQEQVIAPHSNIKPAHISFAVHNNGFGPYTGSSSASVQSSKPFPAPYA